MQIELSNYEVRVLIKCIAALKIIMGQLPCEGDEKRLVDLEQIQDRLTRAYLNESTPGTGRIGSPAEGDGNERVGDNKDTGR